jgi:hypothetical protein
MTYLSIFSQTKTDAPSGNPALSYAETFCFSQSPQEDGVTPPGAFFAPNSNLRKKAFLSFFPYGIAPDAQTHAPANRLDFNASEKRIKQGGRQETMNEAFYFVRDSAAQGIGHSFEF